MVAEATTPLVSELAQLDDIRLTLAGVGDPLLCDGAIRVIDEASTAGIGAIHVETDLLVDGEVIDRLASAPVDVVSVHLPAMTAQTYRAVMGVDRFSEVIENIRRFVTRRAEKRRGVPLIVPIFTKCKENLLEMEAWYDQWLSAVGSALIVGPSDLSKQIGSVAVADMSPPRRKPCARLSSRVTILCDGSVVACENDSFGKSIVGRIGEQSLAEIWQRRLAPLRADKAAGCWNKHSLCAACGDWFRP
jgi:MoaA/NifB/PqqE/SkfB family radical SAM enzyme